MKTCVMCGDTIYSESDEPMCFRCKQSGAHVRLEIYDRADPSTEPVQGFSDAFLGKMNYKSMRRANIKRGNF